MKRRDCLLLFGAAGMAAVGAGCGKEELKQFTSAREETEPAPLPATGDIAPEVRLLNRAAFGPAPGDVARVEAEGAQRWLEAQMNAPTDDEDEVTGLKLRLRRLEIFQHNPHDLLDWPDEAVLRQLQQAAILRAVYSRWQLRERMVDFWSNHFNVYARKAMGVQMLGTDTTGVLRKHALGRFPDMLRASARSPAMLSYLDNQQNRKGVANENYARELMELHSLGVGGGYTQKDVQEVARCLTGWTIEDRFLHAKGTFRFAPELHDDGEKKVLGVTIPAGGGETDGDRVLDIVAHHPSTARYIARKMTRYFHGDEDPALVDKVAAVYEKSGGDIRAMLRPLLSSDALASSPPILKRPFDFLVSSLRVTNADTDADGGLQEYLAQLGQPLFQWPMPDGYPDKTSAWTGSMLARWNFAIDMTQNRVRGTSCEPEQLAKGGPSRVVEAVLALRQAEPAAAGITAALAHHLPHAPAEAVALCLSSPAFQWR